MPPQNRKSEYTILAVLGLVTAVVLLAMAWRGMLRERDSGPTGVRTTRSTNDDGLLIGYTLFERLGIPVRRSDHMLIASQLDAAGTVFLIDPLVPVGAAESADLGPWLARGGVLVTTEVIANLAPALRALAWERPARHRPRVLPVGEGDSTQVPRESQSLPLAREVSTVYFQTADALAPTPSDPNLRQGMEPLFTDERGVRLAQWRVGRGRLILLSDSSFLANRNLAQGDNAVLAANLIAYAQAAAGDPQVVFNEYHFGAGSFGRGMRVLAGLLFTTSAGWAILALTAAGILFLLYRGRQFGPRRDFGQQRRRSKLEYVRAVGATYRAAGAHRLTLRLIYTWFRRQTTLRTGLAANAANRVVAAELARRGPSSAGQYQRILDECDRVLAQPQISPRQLTAAVAQLARIEKEALHGSGNGTQPGR